MPFNSTAMEKITQKDIDWLLNLEKDNPVNRLKKASPKKKFFFRAILFLCFTFGFLILPFFVLIRTSVFLNMNLGWNGWLSLGSGAIATILLLLVYVMLLFRNLQNSRSAVRFGMAGISALVLGFCIYSSFYVSGVHAKNDAIQNVYRSLHPILRVAITTSTLADGDLIITDIQRSPEDYALMRLPLNQHSMHYVQSSGYVHAIDLRTNER